MSESNFQTALAPYPFTDKRQDSEKRNLAVILGSIVIGEASYRIASLPRIRDCYIRIVSPFVFRQNNTFHEQMDTITRKERFLQPYCTSYMV